MELLQSRPKDVIKIIIDDKGNKNIGLAKIIEHCKKEAVDVETNRLTVNKLSKSENAYCIGVFKKYQCDLEKSQNHVVLVNPSDMGNLGTIIRTMLAFDVVNLAIIKPGCDIFDPKVVRSSMGALFRINFEYFDAFDDYKKRFNNNFYTLRTDTDKSINDCKLEEPFSLIFGNESSGLPPESDNVGQGITIPQSESVDSLNLSVAVGITLHHAYYQVA